MNIVLVHGILGFRRKFGIEYFNGIKERLAKFKTNIFVPELNPTGSILTRGEELRAAAFELLVCGSRSGGRLRPREDGERAGRHGQFDARG